MERQNSVCHEGAIKKDKNENDNGLCGVNINADEDADKKIYTYEEAIELAGHGRYNVSLLIVLSFVITSMLVDVFGFSIVASACKCDFNLTMSEYGILTSMPFVGTILMAYFWGYFADTRGRRISLLIAMSVSFLVSIANSFSPNWKVMAVLKLIGASFSSAAQSSSYVLLGESSVVRVRSFYMLLMTSSIMLTPAILFTLSYFVLKADFIYHISFLDIIFTPWRLLTIVLTLPSGFSTLCLLYFYESPKFLVNRGRTNEAIDILKKIHVRNGGTENNYPVKNIVLEDQNIIITGKQSILNSILNHTLPLFKPPLLKITLLLFYLSFVAYSTNNSFQVWFPYLADAIYSSEVSDVSRQGVCDFIWTSTNITGNISSNVAEACSSSLNFQTVITGICHSLTFTVLNLIISKFADRKKSVIIITFIIAIVGGIGTNLAPDPITTMVLYITFVITALAMGVLSAYFVELYPTSNRGMASCLGVMVARLSSLVGINLVGVLIESHCEEAFYYWCVFLLSGIIVAWWCLPPDKPKNKDNC